MFDQQGLIYDLERAFPYLSVALTGDPSWASVQLLVGGDGAIVDESIAARSLTVTSVTVGDPVSATEGGLVFNAAGDEVSAADDTEFAVGSGDFTVETWWAGDGLGVPGGEVIWWSKLGASDKEWTVDLNGGLFQIFASADGAGWTSGLVLNASSLNGLATFFNGAPRHLAQVKVGSDHYFYINGERCPGTVSVATLFDGAAPVTIGLAGVSTPGRYDDFRFTPGVSRYTATKFTISSAKFGRGLSPPPSPPPPPPP